MNAQIEIKGMSLTQADVTDYKLCLNRIGVVAAGIKSVETLRKALTKFRDKIPHAVHKSSYELWMKNILNKGVELALLSQSHYDSRRELPLIMDMIDKHPPDWTKTKYECHLVNSIYFDLHTDSRQTPPTPIDRCLR